MLNGLYKAEYGVNDAFGRSIMCMHNGRMLGGNSAFAHLGTYQESGGEIVGEVITQRHNERVEFDVSKVTELPRVDVIMVYQGAPADLIKAAVDNGAKGIVIAVAGAGATSGNQNEGLNYAASKGVFIVTSTRTGSGRIAPPQQRSDAPAQQVNADQQRRRQFTIAGEDHTPIKARVLLMVALTKTNDRSELQRIFSEY